jgi:hypothetical protein|tara:strand:- start:40 stop:228 length:189 start_codon:yes stop_codon:yes gene_type:complete
MTKGQKEKIRKLKEEVKELKLKIWRVRFVKARALRDEKELKRVRSIACKNQWMFKTLFKDKK